jgi:hypothetical protein
MTKPIIAFRNFVNMPRNKTRERERVRKENTGTGEGVQ